MATLGKGATGKVDKEFRKGQWAAVKKVPGLYMTRHDMNREIDIYNKTAEHPNIVHLVEAPLMHWDNMWHIPLEYIFGEGLDIILFNPRKSTIQLKPDVIVGIITGMCEGLLFMHSNDIVHQDLKPDNIMVESNTCRAVIIDLGFAKFCRDGFSSAPNRGNTAYAAPEVRSFPRTARDKRSDVWALGKIIAEILVGHQIPNMHTATHIEDILKENVYGGAVTKMLDGSPIGRATMAQVIGEIRAAGRAAIERNSLSTSGHRSRSPSPSFAVQPYQSSSGGGDFSHMLLRGLDLPQEFRLPQSLPPNCTVEVNYATAAEEGRPARFTQATVQLRNGRFVHGWSTKVTDDGNTLPFEDH